MKFDINYLIKTAIDAGEKILEVYNSGDFGVTQKEDLSPLTKADTLSNDLISERLAAEYPDIPVISEEGKDIPFETRKEWNRFWLVDPLDGTKEFINRNGEFTVNIAYVEKNKPFLGVIYIPVQDTIYFGAKGLGAFKQSGGKRSRIKPAAAKRGSRIGISSRSHSHEREQEFYKAAGADEVISAGSSLKFCYIAEGRAHLYYRFNPTMEWDTGAGHAIAESAGAGVFNLSYNKESLKNSSFIVSGVNDRDTAGIIRRELGIEEG